MGGADFFCGIVRVHGKGPETGAVSEGLNAANK
jgi:hypothetical protein